MSVRLLSTSVLLCSRVRMLLSAYYSTYAHGQFVRKLDWKEGSVSLL